MSRFSREKPALILDVSRRGLKVETELLALPGDLLRVYLRGSALLATAVYCERTSGKTIIGLKTFYTFKTEPDKNAHDLVNIPLGRGVADQVNLDRDYGHPRNLVLPAPTTKI